MMSLKRKRAPSRPPDEASTSESRSRKAKTVAKDSIAIQLKVEENGRITPPSSSNGVSEWKDSPYDERKVKKQEPLEENMELGEGSSSDVCAICLAPKTDPTVLDNCAHSFCYKCTSRWMKHAGKCPLCMKNVQRFWHHVDLSPTKRSMVVVAELKAAAEAERLAERGQSQPPLDEQECIRLRIRRLQRRLDYVQKQMNGNARVDRSSDLSRTHVRIVNEISKLEMLKRDVTTRGDLVGNIVFRSLIYKDKLDWSSIDRNAIRVPFSPAVFNAHFEDSTERLRNFLERELQIVWRARKPNESRDEYVKARSSVVSEIIIWCSEFQINSPQFSRNLRLIGIFPGYLDRFQSELFEFASSMLSLQDFDRTSAYSSPELRQVLHRRNRRGNNSQEVVMLSDSDSDSVIVALDGGRNRDRHDGDGDDVIVLSDNNSSDIQPIRVPRESNYVRDEATSSNSETSNAGDFYTRPACRLPQFRFPRRTVPMHVVDAFGSSRDLFEHLFTPFALSHSSREQFLHALDVPHTPPGFDTTIVLSSDDENDRSPTRRSRDRPRQVSPSRPVEYSSSNSSQDTVVPNDIDWLTPMDRSHESGSSSRHDLQGLSAASSSSGSVPMQSSSNALRKPKSLFGSECTKKLPPRTSSEVKAGENKLLAALWQERLNRCATSGGPSAVSSSMSPTRDANAKQADGTTSTGPASSLENEAREEADGSTLEEDNISVPRATQGPANIPGDDVSIIDVSSSSVRAGERDAIPVAESSNDRPSERTTSHGKGGKHHKSWKSIFKRFRKKLQRERNPRKRQKAYDFLIEMKRFEEDRRREESSRGRNRERRRLTSYHSSNSSSKRSHHTDDETRRRRSRSADMSHSF
ncbi:unnamed protein product [Haemonchus placei]|uniref:RING-type domain-containing protein n=1 Tax=Haemonchus placei TaxID=6290 RepID=A0A3P7XZQ1_HAEPC|nr:unnamed protein product [Haemonchus placei]